MDYSIKAKNLRTKKYPCYKKIQVVIYNLILSSLVALTCSFLCSSPFWYSSLASSIKYFVTISLPNTWSSFFNPKFLFIVLNVIVAYLVGESKLTGYANSSSANDIYSEYVERTRSLRRQRKTYFHEERKEERKMECASEESENKVYEDKEIVLDVENKEEQKVEKLVEKDQDDEELFQEAESNDDIVEKNEESVAEEAEPEGLPAEELHRRVEDFIARINRQRWIEARMLICGQA